CNEAREAARLVSRAVERVEPRALVHLVAEAYLRRCSRETVVARKRKGTDDALSLHVGVVVTSSECGGELVRRLPRDFAGQCERFDVLQRRELRCGPLITEVRGLVVDAGRVREGSRI